jgi:hypothetical protein
LTPEVTEKFFTEYRLQGKSKNRGAAQDLAAQQIFRLSFREGRYFGNFLCKG